MTALQVEGEVASGPISPDAVPHILATFERGLDQQWVFGRERSGSAILFRGYILGPNFKALIGVGASRVEVVPGNPGLVRYRFSILPTIMFDVALLTVFAAIAILFGSGIGGANVALTVAMLVILLLVHSWIHRVQLPALVQRLADEATRPPA